MSAAHMELLLSFILVFSVLATLGTGLLLVNSKKWTGPTLDVRMEQVEADTQSMRATTARIDRDLTAWHRGTVEANDAIMREVRAIRDSLTQDVSVRRILDEGKAEIDDIKEMIRNLPCLNNAGTTKCPRCREEYPMGRNHTCAAGTEPT